MKALKLVVLGLLTFCFGGCLEMNEEIVVGNNGSGNYAMNMDVGKMMEMMQAFIPAEQQKDMNQVRDTTIQLKGLVDTVTSLSAEQKALLNEGKVRIQMNAPEKVFKLNVQYPFKNMSDLQKLYSSLGDAKSGMGSVFSGLSGGMMAPGGPQPTDIKTINSYYDLETKKNSIVRKLNKEKYATLADDAMMQQMQQMGAMAGGAMGEAQMNTVIKLPAAAKSITGSKAELSTDKKSVIIKNNLMDLFSHPEYFEFSVEY